MAAVAILGATGTIGSALAAELVEHGHAVLLLGRSEEKLQAVCDRLQQPGQVVDSTSSQSLIDCLAANQTALGGYSGLVNCVGSIWLKPIQTTADDDFRRTLETNLFTSFAVVKAAAKFLREQGGSVVLHSSAAATIGLHNHESIAAAKAGIEGLARSAAASLSAYNIRVNCVSPGLTRTDLTRQIWENAASEKASQEMHALGRIGSPAHIVSAIRFLLDPSNDWITGQVLAVDGGLSRIQPRRRISG